MHKTSLYFLRKNRRLSALKRTQRNNRFLGVSARVGAVLFTLAAAAFFVLAVTASSQALHELPSIDTLPILLDNTHGELLQPTKLLDRDALTVLYTYQNEGVERKFLSINPDEGTFISPQLVRAVVAAYEPGFWASPGFSLLHWQASEPMTIAERLVSDLLLWDEAPTITRSLRMRLLAAQVVNHYGRAKTLEWYLNSAWFGGYTYGVESAAQLYLGKSAAEVTLAEAALLIPLIDHPTLMPHAAPAAALSRQQDFLAQMLASGTIEREEYEQALAENINLRQPPADDPDSAAGLALLVDQRLASEISLQRLHRGGLLVVTTLDADLQQQLVCTSDTQLNRIRQRGKSVVAPDEHLCAAALHLPVQALTTLGTVPLAAAGVVLNPKTGEVLAYHEPQKNGSDPIQIRRYQPGSLLSPFVALSAFTQGYSPASLLWDIPAYTNSLGISNGHYRGAVNIRSSVANGYLNPIANLAVETGAYTTWRYAALIGMQGLQNAPDDASPLLGGSENSLLQVAAAFGTLANMGVRNGQLQAETGEILPEMVNQVFTLGGQSIWQKPAAAEAVIVSDSVAYLVNHILSDARARWQGQIPANEIEVASQAAFASGSADDQRQVWGVSYTSDRLVLVWMGPETASGQGAPRLSERMPAGILHALSTYLLQQPAFEGWATPEGVTSLRVCSPSGMLPTADCPNQVYDVFLKGNEPNLTDTLFARVKINRETGLLATVFSPAALVEEQLLMNIPAEGRDWAKREGIGIIPQGYDVIQIGNINPDVNIAYPALLSTVAGKILITGTAGGEGFSSYQVQAGQGIFPSKWLKVAESTQPVSAGTLAEFDTSGLNGMYAIRLSVVDQQNLIHTAYTQVTIDNTPPFVQIIQPSDNQTVVALAGRVTLSASAEDASGIARVEWWVNGREVMEQTTPPFTYPLIAESDTYEVVLKAWDTAGNFQQSATVNFNVQR